tara:strand:- start:1185 stop:1421 length:237 start_codon:yes stop_codon:yes gene_type:complete
MVTNKERIDAETQKRKLRDDKEYNKKVAALFEDEKKEQVKRKKTDDALSLAFRNALLIFGFLIFWDIATNGFRWSWGY